MLSYSIAENVSMQDITDTDLQRVKDCLKRCGLWNFISALPQQELTHIGKDIEEDGIQLSGGQKQKLFMGKQGIYAAMFQAQSQYYEEEGDGCECMAGN